MEKYNLIVKKRFKKYINPDFYLLGAMIALKKLYLKQKQEEEPYFSKIPRCPVYAHRAFFNQHYGG